MQPPEHPSTPEDAQRMAVLARVHQLALRIALEEAEVGQKEEPPGSWEADRAATQTKEAQHGHHSTVES
jgi:hypothetical protein